MQGLDLQLVHLHDAPGHEADRHRHLRGAAEGLPLRGALCSGAALPARPVSLLHASNVPAKRLLRQGVTGCESLAVAA